MAACKDRGYVVPAFAGMALALALAAPAHACKCAMKPLSERLDAHSYVTVVQIFGLALDVEQPQQMYSEAIGVHEAEHGSHDKPAHGDAAAAFDVVDILKGEPATVRRLTTGLGGGDCGVPLQIGHEYLLLGNPADGELRLTTCSGPVDLGLRALRNRDELPPTRESLQVDAARAYLRDRTPIPPCLDDPDGENCDAWFAEKGL